MFDKPGVYYSNNPFTIFDSNWLLDSAKIQDLKKHKIVVLDFASEHYGIDGLDHVYHAVENAELNFLLLSHDPADHKKFDRMFFYPHWYHWAKRNFIISKLTNSFDKTYKLGCLNRVPRSHRVYNYVYSYQQPYFKDSIFTFHRDDVAEQYLDLDEYTLTTWNVIKNSLPYVENLNELVDHRCDLLANTDAYVHLVTETAVCPRIFLSEKTWKPIASGQFLLVLGNPGTVGYLRDQGVDVFDDLIDHSYDLVLDWKTRVHQIHQQMEKLVSLDLKELYINTASRRQANTEKFFSGQFDNQYLKTIQQCINMLS